ncbi:MAG: polyphosphate kinase 1 [Myxococcota bacterium]
MEAVVRPDSASLFVNRELSWLAFNARVLEEAQDPAVPLLERVKFLGIFSANLDEFFMVRWAGIWRQIDAGVTVAGPDGFTPRASLEAVSVRARELVEAQHRTLRELLPELARRGIHLLRERDLDEAQRAYLNETFERRVLPVLTPMAVDPAHPFPWLANKALCLMVQLEPADDPGLPVARQCVLHMPAGGMPRFVRVPSSPGRYEFVLLEDLIRMHVDRLFTGSRVSSCRAIRVTRDAELDLQEGEAEDLLATIEEAVRNRRMGAAVRLQYERGLPPEQLALLVRELELDPLDLYPTDGMTALTDLTQLYGEIDLPQLKEWPFHPQPIPEFEARDDPFAAIRAGDVLVHHPYQDFQCVTRFVRAAAEDPDVLAIKMTLYRVSGDSPIAQALLAAAKNGKEVAVLVELRARFSEEHNIAWAKRLEASGAHVVYGIVGKKTHCKATLVVRREAGGLRRYCHLSTGNYNDQTARVYTDLGLFTCRETFGEDLTHLFNLLTGYVRPPPFHHLVLSPTHLRDALVARIRRESAHARAGRPAGIRGKLNALADPVLITELYEASRDGVPIDLVVRGVCCLRPGVPGLSENIRVVSIVDRFLEHARVLIFENGGEPEYLLSSADWMRRNLDGRVETTFPILEPALQRRIEDILAVQLADDTKAREVLPDGTHVRRRRGGSGDAVRAQERLISAAYTLADAVDRA